MRFDTADVITYTGLSVDEKRAARAQAHDLQNSGSVHLSQA